ncbi:MAG: fibronectin type III domain-containing protein [Desulfobacterium sp.]|jgi:hypothetical protein|nr:fibronectin type III domain-containing protein [Desulfobacterium sp.]
MSPSSTIFVRVFCLAILLLGVTGLGCGKKAPPLPPIKATIAAPSNLALAVHGTMATLTWLHGKKTGAPEAAGFEIDLATLEGDCEGCPLRFIPLARVDARTFEFTVEIQPGLRHYFRIRAYTDAGVLSDSSNTVHVAPKK